MMKKYILAIFIVLFLASCQSRQKELPVDLINLFLDTAHRQGLHFSSASSPFGMVSLFPNMHFDGAMQGRFHLNYDTVKEIGHIHMYPSLGVSVLPVTFNKNNVEAILHDPSSHFDRNKEIAYPGYHAFTLGRYHIRAELTATERVGFHRYTFSKGDKHGVVFFINGHKGLSETIEGGFKQVNNNEIRGYMANAPDFMRPSETHVYFCAVFCHPIKEILLSTTENEIRPVKQWNGKNGKILVVLDEGADQPVMMKVGLSFTSEIGAVANIQTESPGWKFEKTVESAKNNWNALLSRIEVEGSTLVQRCRFYTDLWHALQGKRIVNDVDGRYAYHAGNLRVIHQLPIDNKGKPIFNMYSNDAFCGGQWAMNTLWHLVYPEMSEEFCRSFLEYSQKGEQISRGSSHGNNTFAMDGTSATPFVVGAIQKGIDGFGPESTYQVLKKNHLPDGSMLKAGFGQYPCPGRGTEAFQRSGFTACPLNDTVLEIQQNGTCLVLDNAIQDWCLAQLAGKLNYNDDYGYFLNRSLHCVQAFSPDNVKTLPQKRNGEGATDIGPLVCCKNLSESKGIHMTWLLPHNLQPFFSFLGGEDSVINMLNAEFENNMAHRFCHADPEKEKMVQGIQVNFRPSLINCSNLLNCQAVFLFNHAGAPWLTQYWSRMVLDSVYSRLYPHPVYNGFEYMGLKRPCNVMMKLGIFQITWGCEENPAYELGSPIFDKITLHLNPQYHQARHFTIEVLDNSPQSPFIQYAEINNNPLNKFYINHSDIRDGASIKLKMGYAPNKMWGVGK
jgi:predicted alpha-1,2-mannosidase